jgi:hypothetical protein
VFWDRLDGGEDSTELWHVFDAHYRDYSMFVPVTAVPTLLKHVPGHDAIRLLHTILAVNPDLLFVDSYKDDLCSWLMAGLAHCPILVQELVWLTRWSRRFFPLFVESISRTKACCVTAFRYLADKPGGRDGCRLLIVHPSAVDVIRRGISEVSLREWTPVVSRLARGGLGSKILAVAGQLAAGVDAAIRANDEKSLKYVLKALAAACDSRAAAAAIAGQLNLAVLRARLDGAVTYRCCNAFEALRLAVLSYTLDGEGNPSESCA